MAGAREGAKQALAELRDFAQGLRPGAAGRAGPGRGGHFLAARGPVPTTVEVDLAERLTPTAEGAVYFGSHRRVLACLRG